MKNFDYEAIRDYAIYALLVIVFVAMVGSCLMLIKTQDPYWYFGTIFTTMIAVAAAGTKEKDEEVIEIIIIDEEDEEEQA